MRSTRFPISAGAIEGVHYNVIDGEVIPVVRGGDGPTDPVDLEAVVSKLLGEDNKALSDETLTALATADLNVMVADLDRGFAAALANLPADPTDEQLDALETVKLARAVAQSQLDARKSEGDKRKERLASLAGEMGVKLEGEGEGGTGGEGEGEGAGAGEGGEGAAGEGEGEGGTGAGTGEGEGSGEGEGAAGEGEGGVKAASKRPSFAQLSTEGKQVEPGEEGPKVRKIRAAAGFQDVKPGTEVVLESLAEQVAGLHGSMQVEHPRGKAGRVTLGYARSNPAPHIVEMPDGETNGNSYIDAAVKADADNRMALAVLLASGKVTKLTAGAVLQGSGGTCVVPEPNYELQFVGKRGASFVDGLPTVNNKRPIKFYKWFETRLDQANPWLAGMDNVTEAQDAAGYGDPDADPSTVPEGGAPYKHCVKIDCPTPVETAMEANYKCTVMGRFQAISFPEYTRIFDTSTGLWWDVYRDTWAIHKFTAKTTALGHNMVIDVSNGHDAVIELHDVLMRMLAHVRSARADDTISLNVGTPGWLKYQLAGGFARQMDLDGSKLKASPDQVWGMVATEGIDLRSIRTEMGPTDDGSHTVLPLPVDDVPAWPTQTRLFVYPQGGMFRQTFGGDVAFGLTETLYKTNDFGTFMETFETVGFRTDDLWTIDINLCDSGTQGGSAVRTCPSGS